MMYIYLLIFIIYTYIHIKLSVSTVFIPNGNVTTIANHKANDVYLHKYHRLFATSGARSSLPLEWPELQEGCGVPTSAASYCFITALKPFLGVYSYKNQFLQYGSTSQKHIALSVWVWLLAPGYTSVFNWYVVSIASYRLLFTQVHICMVVAFWFLLSWWNLRDIVT